MRSLVIRPINAILRCFGCVAVETRAIDWQRTRAFRFAGRDLRYFFHYYNCGWPPERCTERSAELAIADHWLRQVDSKAVWEIGAVTPYYWPGRVGCVVDPVDAHPDVAIHESLFSVDFRGRPVLSISTLEHTGTGDYGIAEKGRGAIDALNKVVAESPTFLITIPVGYNPDMDRFCFGGGVLPGDVKARFLVRVSESCWREETEGSSAKLPYGPHWANALVILERGNVY